jgi:hypothetical protein
MTDLKCPACGVAQIIFNPGGGKDGFFVSDGVTLCTGRAGCVREAIAARAEADAGVDWGRATQYLKDNEQGLMDLMAKVDDLMVDGAVSHAAIVEHPERETPALESAPAGANVPDGKADIVERLRDGPMGDDWGDVDIDGTWSLMTDAAAEIARLRAEVERLTGERDHWISRALHADIIAELLDDYADHLEADRAAFAQRVAEAVREACATAAQRAVPADCDFEGVWGDYEHGVDDTHEAMNTRMAALDLGPIVAAALAKEGE